MLVVHDPTTAIDSATESRIAAGVRELRRGRTTVLVTSSPALLAVADRVALIVRAYSLEEEHTERVARRSREAVALSLRGVRLVLGFYGRLHVAEYPGLVAVLCAGFVLGARQRRVGGHGDRGGALLPQPVRAGERRLGASTSPTRSTCSTSSSTSTGTRAAPS